MYIFGGRTEEGSDLGDLAAFRISSRRWYTFQNMGPSPSPRSGHSMTAYGKQIVVLAGEPSTATREAGDLGIVYLLDTSKIRYPNDAPTQAAPGADRIPGARRPSGGEKTGMMGATRALPSRDGSSLPEPKRLNGPGPPRESVVGAGAGRGIGQPGMNGNDMNGVAPGSAQPQGAPQAAPQIGGSKLPRASMAQSTPGPPPQQQAPTRPNGAIPGPGGRGKPLAKPERGFGPTVDTTMRNPTVESVIATSSPGQTRNMSPARESPQTRESPVTNGRRTPTQQQQGSKAVTNENAPPVSMNMSGSTRSSSKTRSNRQQSSIDSTSEQSSLKNVSMTRGSSPPPPTRQGSNQGNPLGRKGSARNSQTVTLLKELDAAKNRNAWYASELELARKAGYTPNPSTSPVLDQRAAESFDDEDKPLIEALLAMKTELANVQGSVDQQAVHAAKKIAEVEKQRDAAISEAVYAKARLAAHSGSQSSTPQPDSESRDLGLVTNERSTDISRKLAAALAEQKDLQYKLERMTAELEHEKRNRQLAEDTSKTAQARMSELESYKQQNSGEVERLKAELHESQIKAREESIVCAEAVAAAQLLQADKDDLQVKYKDAIGSTQDHSDTFASLREAIASSADMRNLLERKLDEERSHREKVETKLAQLKAEHENRTSELEIATRKLRDAEDLAEQHATEARTHREAVLAGLDRVAARDVNSRGALQDERSVALQAQVTAANALVRKHQDSADTASEKLRRAEERIAGLEAYQEQVSRDGLSIRKQLQSYMKQVQTLEAANSDMKRQLDSQQLEANTAHFQHNTLKDILHERGISPASVKGTRGLSSPRSGTNTPDLLKVRDLEQQLANSQQAHEETKQTHEMRAQETESIYREKLSQLENDYQSAVHYVKGTEKMLKRMKDELAKYKSENTRLTKEVEEAHAKNAGLSREAAPSGWEEERASLNEQIESLQAEMKASVGQLERQLSDVRKELATTQQEHGSLKNSHEETQRNFATSTQQSQSSLAQLQQENDLLEHRAQDAEQKVALLLDQVEQSVGTYRRQSRPVETATSGLTHQRNLSATDSVSETSLYDGGNRNSTALDNLANELETLRSHWQNTNKNYRLSNAFDFEDRPSTQRQTGENLSASNAGEGLSGSLADWRKRLDSEETEARMRKDSLSSSTDGQGAGSSKREMDPSEVGTGSSNKNQVNLI